jgi:hypothetical protein
MVRARSVFMHRALPVGCGFLLLLFGSQFIWERSRPRLRFLLLPLTLPTGFSPVSNFGKKFPDFGYIVFAPQAHANSANPLRWQRYLLRRNVPFECDETDAYSFRGFAGGVENHTIPRWYQITIEGCQ